jgi:histidinol-phosphate aminotransferase
MSERDLAVQRLVIPQILETKAYHVQNAKGYIKLDAMENPFIWPPEMKAEWADIAANTDVNRYPDPEASGVKSLLKQALPIPEAASVVLGNGSDELIQLLAMLVGKPGAKIYSPMPSFVMYRAIASSLGLDFISSPLNDDFSLNIDATLNVIANEQPELLFIAWPNNPTGQLYPVDDLIAIIECAEGLVVIDEAYMPFASDTFLHRVMSYPNVLVMGTLSKVGLAGLRLGFLAGPSEWCDQINKIRLPYNIGVLTQAAAEFALSHFDVLKAQTVEIKKQREMLAEQLAKYPGFEVYPSQANFILVRSNGKGAQEVFDSLKQHNILIKTLHGTHPLLDNCLRITVSSEQENKMLLDALSRIFC